LDFALINVATATLPRDESPVVVIDFNANVLSARDFVSARKEAGQIIRLPEKIFRHILVPGEFCSDATHAPLDACELIGDGRELLCTLLLNDGFPILCTVIEDDDLGNA
jgi:hypothetical protein